MGESALEEELDEGEICFTRYQQRTKPLEVDRSKEWDNGPGRCVSHKNLQALRTGETLE
jgi:hypothetical protein